MKVDLDITKFCSHKSHLFENPICKKQSLCKKICNVIFHILTLGIPFIIYRIITCCSKPTKVPPVLPFTSDISSELRKELLEVVDKQLELYPDIAKIESYDWSNEVYNGPCKNAEDVIYHPKNKTIDKLMALYRGPLLDNLKTALIKNDRDKDQLNSIYKVWLKEDVVKAGDDLLKVGLAIYLLTVEDFEGVNHPDTGESLKQIVASGKYYQNRTLYCLWDIYSLLRLNCRYNKKWLFPYKSASFNVESLSLPPIKKLIRKANIQCIAPLKLNGQLSEWKSLYNKYCKHFETWISQDTSSESPYKTEDYIPPLDNKSQNVYSAKFISGSFVDMMLH